MPEVPIVQFTDLEIAIPGLVAGITTRSGPQSKCSARGGDFDFGLSTGGDPAEPVPPVHEPGQEAGVRLRGGSPPGA